MRTFIVLAALATAAHAGTVTLYSGRDCSGDELASATFSGSSCAADSNAGGSVEVMCSGSTYSANYYLPGANPNTNCQGPADYVVPAGTATGCGNAPANDRGIGSAKVDCSSSCFSSEATLQLETGATVPVAAVRVGDRVLSMSPEGKPMYDKVFRITHYDPTEVNSFQRITTSSGDVLELTGQHLIHVDTCCDLSNAVPAYNVKVGSTLFLASGQAVTVTAVESVVRTGTFNLHTLSGNVVVSNVVATHFGTSESWSPMGRSLATYWYHAVNAVSAVVGAEDASAAKHNNLRIVQ